MDYWMGSCWKDECINGSFSRRTRNWRKKLLIKQAAPASIGILFMSVNILVDTIFVGQWIGSLAIAAVTVVLPITFFISSLGMAIGIGGGSVLSRALVQNQKNKSHFC
jgi:Na+-driven multidrug efflux pump